MLASVVDCAQPSLLLSLDCKSIKVHWAINRWYILCAGTNCKDLPDNIAEVRQLYLDTLKNWPRDEVPETKLSSGANPNKAVAKKAPAKKAPAKKTPTKKTPAKTTAKKTAKKTANKATVKKAASDGNSKAATKATKRSATRGRR